MYGIINSLIFNSPYYLFFLTS